MSELPPGDADPGLDVAPVFVVSHTFPDSGSFVVTVRIFPDGVEVEVLHAGAVHRLGTSPRVGDEPFAAWLENVLAQQGLSQDAAAQRVGVSVRTISRWLHGDTEPRLRDLRRVHAVFGPPAAG